MNSVEAWRVVAVVAVVAAVIAYAVLSGVWVATDAGWYRSLIQPSWQPPPWIFGVIWPYNFIVLATVGSLIEWRAPSARVLILLVFLLTSIAAALTWAYTFYVPHNFLASAIALTSAAILTIPVTAVAFQTGVLFGVLLLPYQAWVGIAASLSWGYLRLNA